MALKKTTKQASEEVNVLNDTAEVEVDSTFQATATPLETNFEVIETPANPVQVEDDTTPVQTEPSPVVVKTPDANKELEFRNWASNNPDATLETVEAMRLIILG